MSGTRQFLALWGQKTSPFFSFRAVLRQQQIISGTRQFLAHWGQRSFHLFHLVLY